MAAVTRYACARCGKRQPADQMVYSRFTKNRYCRQLDDCARRAKRRKR